ncbi:FKBP-type peptidyl-prolyl cis-trans isomerase [Erythrobacter sp. MTPC3]|uniref:FKBP-type peptidyl-prolyl cis-trans isomerase n=1 Tax=Erythrobacter sp. MTPC3 TaxID=3056564 RepID=UPI0036F1CDE9
MTEITRVPIKPVSEGSLTKLWLGIAIAILLGAGLAWAAMPSGPRGLEVETLVEGEGPMVQVGDVAFVRYKGKIADTGEVFDESRDIPLPVQGLFPEGTPFPVDEGATIDGFFNGLQQMQKGGEYELYIPSDQAYGSEPPPGAPIPPDADLIFEIEVVDFMSKDTFDRNLQILQQQMQQGMGAPPPAQDAPGAAPGN